MVSNCNAFIELQCFLLAALMISVAAPLAVRGRRQRWLGSARPLQFEVGDSARWVPPGPYNDWAGKFLLFVNDSLVFKYNPSVDSVVRVSAEEYNSCSISNPIASFEDGNTVFKFSNHGHFYFVSGNFSSCKKGEKIIADVLSPGKSSRQSPDSASPARGPVKGLFWVDNVGCCQNKCCDGEFNPVCCGN